MGRLTLVVLVAGLLSAGSFHALSEVQAELARPSDGVDVFTRVAQGPVVVLAKVAHVRVKATLAVERTLRGSGAPAEIALAFRGANMGRQVNAPPFEVRVGERAIFVLTPLADSRGEPHSSGALQPAGGWRGKIPLPAEGAEALVEAVQAMVRLQDSDDPQATVRELTNWIAGQNPWLIDTALEQAARLGLADRAMIAELLPRAGDANPARRARVAKALGTALARGRLSRPAEGSAGPPSGEDDVAAAARETLVRLARTDPEAGVRLAAVRELGRSGFEAALPVLAAIARDDASQEVRYEAAAAIARAAPD